MNDHHHTENKKIRISSLIPLRESHFPPGLLLLQENGDKTYLRSLRQIDQWPRALKQKVAAHLNLIFGDLRKDHFGNVCFADEPQLRPEYRTLFTPIDLFDYYYAAWQNPGTGSRQPRIKDHTEYPHPALFWDFVQTGALLRDIHLSPGTGPLPYKTDPITLPDQTTISIEKENFQAAPDHTHGDLYLSERYCFKDIPAETYRYHINGFYPVREWIKNHHNQPLTPARVRELSILIAKIEQTSIWQKELEKRKAEK